MSDTLKFTLTFIVAASGLVLSIYNAWKAGQRDKVNLKVTPKIYRDLPEGRHATPHVPTDRSHHWLGLCIEVVNKGQVAVTIDEVGVLLAGRDERIIMQPHFSDGEKLPRRLEPRASLSAYIASTAPNILLKEGLPHAKGLYALTACGVTVKGKSPVATWLIQLGKNAG